MRENKAIQITNLQMYTWRKTVNRREHLNLAKFKSCCARTNKGGKNLISSSGDEKLEQIQDGRNNFDDTERISLTTAVSGDAGQS